MIRNPVDTSFSINGEAWFIDDAFLIATQIAEVDQVQRAGANELRVWPSPGYSMETVAAIVQKEIDKRYGQTE